MRLRVAAIVVAVAVGLAIVALSWFIPYHGGTYVPYSNAPGEQYSTLQNGVPFPYYSRYSLTSCVLSAYPTLPTGVCLISQPSTFSMLPILFDSAFWVVLSFGILTTVGYLGNHRRIPSRLHDRQGSPLGQQ